MLEISRDRQGGDTAMDCNPGISSVFANPESWDLRCPNPGISELQKLVEIVLFHCEMMQIRILAIR